jgi:hypothetical protein
METDESSSSIKDSMPVNVRNTGELIIPTSAMQCPNSIRFQFGDVSPHGTATAVAEVELRHGY